MRNAKFILAAAGAAAMLAGTAAVARAESSVDVHNSWWDQVEKAQACAMQPGNPYAYSIQSPCISAPPAAYRDARRAYPEYYGRPAYGYAVPYPGYGYAASYAPYRYPYGYGY